MKARYYSPKLGRFLQPDPIGYGGGLNLYEYGASDPVNLYDPLGLATLIYTQGPSIIITGPNPYPIIGGIIQNVTAIGANPGSALTPGLAGAGGTGTVAGGALGTGLVVTPKPYVPPAWTIRGVPGVLTALGSVPAVIAAGTALLLTALSDVPRAARSIAINMERLRYPGNVELIHMSQEEGVESIDDVDIDDVDPETGETGEVVVVNGRKWDKHAVRQARDREIPQQQVEDAIDYGDKQSLPRGGTRWVRGSVAVVVRNGIIKTVHSR